MNTQPPPAYVRHTGEVFVELARGDPPCPMPAELQSTLSERCVCDRSTRMLIASVAREFSERMASLRKLFGVYVWSLPERIYIYAGIALTVAGWIAAGIAGNILARRAFDQEGEDFDGSLTTAQFVEAHDRASGARMVAAGIVVRP
jgi:hypothetical protein